MDNKGKLKITKEQYNRIFATGLINEMQMPKVKGGLNRVDKEFKSQGITEGDNQLKKETIELIKYLYRKTDELSPFWGENQITYDDICNALESKNIIIKKDGKYELSKSLGSPQRAIEAVQEELTAMLSNDETPKTDIEEGDWFDNHPDHPANQPDPEFKKAIQPKNIKFNVVSLNGEMALLEADGVLYAFDYSSFDENIFKDYADLEVVDTYPDGEGGYSVDYSDDFDIDAEVISNFVNGNLDKLKVGKGLAAWEDGQHQLVAVDDELKQDLLNLYDKDTNLVNALGGINENESPEDRMSRLKNVISQKRGESQQLDAERFKKRDLENSKALSSKPEPKPEPKKPLGQHNIFGGVDEMDGAMGGTNTASVGGQYTPSMTGAPVVKRELPSVPVVKEASTLGKGYTHFAIFKADGKIADGWDYSSLYDEYEKSFDNDSIKYYTKQDLKDNFPDNKTSDFKIVTRKSLEKSGVNPSDTNNWYKISVNETLDVAGAGNFQYDTPGGLTMDLGKNNPKSKAEKKTQWAGGSFVDFNECVKLNNKPAGTGCSAGAVDNVVKLKQSKGNVNAPSLGEGKIYEAIAKKTGKTIEEVKAIIASKNSKG
jgi:hypothetical protein